MGQSNPSVPISPPGICLLVGPCGGDFMVRVPLPGWGIFPFSIFHLKICLFKQILIDISVKNIFNTFASKRNEWFSFHHHATPQYLMYSSKKLLPTIVISSEV